MSGTTIGVIGAGVMGIGIAECFAKAGYKIILIDLSDAILKEARKRLEMSIGFSRLFQKKEEPAPDLKEIMEKITFSTDYDDVRSADFLIENVTEKWEIKEEVHRKLEQILQPGCKVAANTSAISITRIGSIYSDPSRVLGMHFMNPVPMKPAVEVIKGYHTSEETIAEANALLNGAGKEGIIVNDVPGFVSNRVLMLTINEAIFEVQDGVASVEDIDRIFKLCFGHKMGPLETCDLIGLDTILYSLEVLFDSYKDTKFRPCPLLQKMVDAGLHGRKSGKGFYSYE
ncbi:3-hydroxyacyl-CoA dehydrogenase family protein [Paenibacillus lutrae]|uniref:3-hydroxybutyryl-CoA dehydrogenase n=1 Tax=Paenibacillus lutrae TaxID=2078573 RepID=A0A7X3FFA4_9BACL|nr:3-hydroxyacyl-CoA dehydrogenase NAD-binding domain-containing protein [Paenibacillus lutrae]MVO98617.1 3-hydroxybutyryl-CoA dehydrogenase [Paenibacillus lutrae]